MRRAPKVKGGANGTVIQPRYSLELRGGNDSSVLRRRRSDERSKM
jgi:hypothetical protein